MGETNRNCNLVEPAHALHNPGFKRVAQVLPRTEQLIISKSQYRFHPAVNGGMGSLIDVSRWTVQTAVVLACVRQCRLCLVAASYQERAVMCWDSRVNYLHLCRLESNCYSRIARVCVRRYMYACMHVCMYVCMNWLDLCRIMLVKESFRKGKRYFMPWSFWLIVPVSKYHIVMVYSRSEEFLR